MLHLHDTRTTERIKTRVTPERPRKKKQKLKQRQNLVQWITFSWWELMGKRRRKEIGTQQTIRKNEEQNWVGLTWRITHTQGKQ